jgi:hypothetical protein
MPYIKQEVGVAGTRIAKTDVGWLGSGYKYAFDGVGQCVSGIEENSSGRRFVWTVEGWAGTHRMAVMCERSSRSPAALLCALRGAPTCAPPPLTSQGLATTLAP